MTNLLVIFATAFVLAISTVPVARRVALRTGMVDEPNVRKIHQVPIPRMGGVAMYGAFMLALILFADRFYVPQLISIIVGATLVSFLGFWDDRIGLNAWVKLAGQIAAAGLLIATGVSVDLLHQPVFDIAITLLWIVGITNAMNLLDNMDGLSGGIAAIAAGFFLLLSATNGQYLVGSLSAALLGASIGFLVYNFNPASIFMGDAGSLFIGFMLAAVGLKLRFPTHPLVITWFLPILVLGVPIFDTTLVCISRLRRGLNPLTTPGKDHLSHRLVERGLTRREAVLTLYLAATVLGVIAMFCVEASIAEAYIAFAGVLLAGALALYEFEFRKSSLRK